MAKVKPVLRDALTLGQKVNLYVLGLGLKRPQTRQKLTEEQKERNKLLTKQRNQRLLEENRKAAETIRWHRENDKWHNSYEPDWIDYYLRDEEPYGDRKGKREYLMKYAKPKWANDSELEKIYRMRDELNSESGEQYEVDHVIPICGKLVCGLHVPENLRIIPKAENRLKSNRFEVE